MLGTLARWLRILGFDVYFADRSEDDEDILERAEKEKRIILTRDRYLVAMARRRNLKALEIRSRDLDEQIRTVTRLYPVKEDKVLSRCSICNTPLMRIGKDEVRGRVPDGVYLRHEEFWYCKECKRIYWKGSHWEKMRERIERVKPRSS